MISQDPIVLIDALTHANLQAFGRVVRAGETCQTDDAYRWLFGSSVKRPKLFDSFDDHPRRAFKSPWGWTSAAGAYQFMCAVPGKVKTDTWGELVREYGFRDFTPKTQDIAFAALVLRRKALADVIAGRFEKAVHKCNREWASLPESPYGQPTRTMEEALATYLEHGGTLA